MTYAENLDALPRIQLLQQHLLDALLPALDDSTAAEAVAILSDQVARLSGRLASEVDEQLSAWLAQTLRALDRRS